MFCIRIGAQQYLVPLSPTVGPLGKGSHQKKKFFLSDTVQKGGGVQPESESFEVVLFTPSLTFFWTLIGWRVGG